MRLFLSLIFYDLTVMQRLTDIDEHIDSRSVQQEYLLYRTVRRMSGRRNGRTRSHREARTILWKACTRVELFNQTRWSSSAGNESIARGRLGVREPRTVVDSLLKNDAADGRSVAMEMGKQRCQGSNCLR